jgi:hypothetical protein
VKVSAPRRAFPDHAGTRRRVEMNTQCRCKSAHCYSVQTRRENRPVGRATGDTYRRSLEAGWNPNFADSLQNKLALSVTFFRMCLPQIKPEGW